MLHGKAVFYRFHHFNIIVFIPERHAFIRSDSQKFLVFTDPFCFVRGKWNKIHPRKSGCHNSTSVFEPFSPVLDGFLRHSFSLINCNLHTRLCDLIKTLYDLTLIFYFFDHQMAIMFCLGHDIIKILCRTGKFRSGLFPYYLNDLSDQFFVKAVAVQKLLILDSEPAIFTDKCHLVLYRRKKIPHIGILSATGCHKEDSHFFQFLYQRKDLFRQRLSSTDKQRSIQIAGNHLNHAASPHK